MTTLYGRLNDTFKCEECNDRIIPRSEYNHHRAHHQGNCRCNMAEHRMIPMWLRNKNGVAKILA